MMPGWIILPKGKAQRMLDQIGMYRPAFASAPAEEPPQPPPVPGVTPLREECVFKASGNP